MAAIARHDDACLRAALVPGSELSAGAGPDATLRLAIPSGVIALSRLDPAMVVALDLLQGGASLHRLAEAVAAGDGATALPRLYVFLERLCRHGALSWSVCTGGLRLATLEPLAGESPRPWLSAGRFPVQLSRFAYTRAAAGTAFLESPLSPCRVELHDWRAAALVHKLSRPCDASDLGDDGAALALVSLLAHGGLLESAGEDDPAWDFWELHDLLLHARSRGQGRGEPAGSGRRPRGSEPPPVPPERAGGGLPLFHPDLDALLAADPPFTRVLEARRSVRDSAAPPTARQLGEFLYRTARLRRMRPGAVGPVCDRPYPSAGARHPLEIYPLVRCCPDLEPGLYHYGTAAHRLYPVRGLDTEVAQLAAEALPYPSAPPPPVVIILAARFQRTQWVYPSIAYSLILKDTGVLLQTMYLVATAMGLAPCAIGSGCSDLFARCAGTHPAVESSVGELALGGGEELPC